jgi:FeS assembly SUF system protein
MQNSNAKDDAMDRAQTILDSHEEGQPSPERMAEVTALGERIIEELKTVYDPEIPVNIYELGLIYRIDIEDDNKVALDMTLTSPHCPVAESLPNEVEQKVSAVEGVAGCRVSIVWDPPWAPSMMTEEAQLELGMIY